MSAVIGAAEESVVDTTNSAAEDGVRDAVVGITSAEDDAEEGTGGAIDIYVVIDYCLLKQPGLAVITNEGKPAMRYITPQLSHVPHGN